MQVHCLVEKAFLYPSKFRIAYLYATTSLFNSARNKMWIELVIEGHQNQISRREMVCLLDPGTLKVVEYLFTVNFTYHLATEIQNGFLSSLTKVLCNYSNV